MQTSLAARWNPRQAFAPAARYLQQPVRLFRQYDRANLRDDALAGITVAVILLPQAIAFSLIAELPPQMGIYAAIVGGIVAALWGSSNQLHTGPTNALSLLILSSLSSVALPNTEQYILAAGLMAVMVGVLQLGLGLLRLGVIVNFVSHSVIVGFATGAAVLIALRQLGPLLGVSLPGGNVVETLVGVVDALPDTQLMTAAIGIGTMVLIVVLRRIDSRLPGPLIGMVVASVAVFLLGDQAAGVATIGELPRGFPPLAPLPLTDLGFVADLSTGALAVAAIGLVESTAISRSVANQTGQRLESNQEFVGQGLANIAVGFFSGYGVAGSFSRTAVNFRAGARTPIAAVLSSIFVLGLIFFVGSLGRYLPVSALAGVLIVTAYGMIDRAEIGRIMRGAPGDAVIMLVTFLGTLFLDIEFAVLAGILLSFVLYIVRTSTPRVHVVLPDDSYRHFTYQPGKESCPQVAVIEVHGDLYFGAVHHVEEQILEYLDAHPDQRYLLIRMHQVNQIDFTGIHMLESVIHSFRERGGDVYFVRVGYRVRRLMESTGCADYIGEDNFLDEDEAIGYLFNHVLDPAICIYECPVRAFKECQNLPKRLDLIGIADPGSSADGVPKLATVSPEALWAAQHRQPPEQPPMIVDVREPREYKQAHIDTAVSLPLSDLLAGDVALPPDQDIVLVCRTGRRSRRAAGILLKAGNERIAVLDGGLQAWEAAGLIEAVEL